MNCIETIIHALLAVGITLSTCVAAAQDTSNLPYLNPKLSPEERASDLVHRMTLSEKASQLVNQARAIPRLKVPAYDWWSEALHGVIADGTTELSYDADAAIGGLIAGVSPRILSSIAKRLAGAFFSSVDEMLTSPLMQRRADALLSGAASPFPHGSTNAR